MLNRSTRPLFCLAASTVCLLVIFPSPLRAQAIEKENWFPLKSGTYCMALSPDGKFIACVGSGQGIQLVATSSGKEVARLGSFSTCYCVRFTPDGKCVFHWSGRPLTQGLGPGDWEGYVDVFDIKSKKLRKRVTLTGFHGANSALVALDNKTLLAGGTKEVAAFFDIDTGKKKGVIAGKHRPRHAAISRDRKWLLTADYNSKTRMARLRLWDIKKKKLAHELYDHTAAVTGLAFSPDGKWCASATADGRLWVFDREKGTEKARTPTLWSGRRPLCFTPDGKTLIAGGRAFDGGLVWWDWQKDKDIRRGLWPRGKTVQALKDLQNKAWHTTAFALTRDGKRLYAATWRWADPIQRKAVNSIVVWDLTKPFNPKPPKPKPKEPSPEPDPEPGWWFGD